MCPQVTASANASYFVAVGLYAFPAQKSIYISPDGDEGLNTGAVLYRNSLDILDPSTLAPPLIAGNPWVLDTGFKPVPYWFVYPEALEN